jgi:hypothetical protein
MLGTYGKNAVEDNEDARNMIQITKINNYVGVYLNDVRVVTVSYHCDPVTVHGRGGD